MERNKTVIRESKLIGKLAEFFHIEIPIINLKPGLLVTLTTHETLLESDLEPGMLYSYPVPKSDRMWFVMNHKGNYKAILPRVEK